MCHRQLMGTKLTLAAMIFGQERALSGRLQKQDRLLPTLIFFLSSKQPKQAIKAQFRAMGVKSS